MPERLNTGTGIQSHQEDKFTGGVLSHELAQKVSSCLQELPANTTIRDLWSWKDHPFLLPTWTHLMLQLSSNEKTQLSATLSVILRSVPFGKEEELTLGRLTAKFSLDHIAGVRVGKRKAFFIAAFQNNPTEESAAPAINLDQLKAQLAERGLLIPAKPRVPKWRKPRTPRVPKILNKKILTKEEETIEIEDELWQYAVEYDLLDKIVASGRISPAELKELEYYFKGRPHKTSMPIPKALMDKFSIAVARLA